jgi:hypothetical protein
MIPSPESNERYFFVVPPMNDRKAPHLKAAAQPVRYTICDRSGNKKCAGSGEPIPSRGLQSGHPPAPVERQIVSSAG